MKKIQYTGDDLGDIFTDLDRAVCFDSNDYDDFSTSELYINRHNIIVVHSNKQTIDNHS